MTFSAFLFYTFSAILIGSAISVVSTRHPIHSALSLVLAFFTTAAIWVTLGAEFLGLALVVIYVGAVMVFFLFVIMMVNVRDFKKPKSNWRVYFVPLLLVGVLMFAELAMLIIYSTGGRGAVPEPETRNTFLLGKAMFDHYIYALEIVAVLLLSAMVAAIALTHRKTSSTKRQVPSEQIAIKRDDRVRLVKMDVVRDEDEPEDNKKQADK
ncbi:MAG: NADH-quinone oxidoreductase subunit J [Burkholderiales bacterium]|jgi:NADH-quinone oxidoreductase subunit J|nr:NADH-quinone oxidoreductase subunit J [Burkholderiales bacterium]